MYEKPTFSERLKELMEEKGIKSVELARAIGALLIIKGGIQ